MNNVTSLILNHYKNESKIKCEIVYFCFIFMSIHFVFKQGQEEQCSGQEEFL